MKITKHENYRVVVAVRKPILSSEPNKSLHWEDEADSIVYQIKRHVDGTSDIKIESDLIETCSFCGGEWVECEAQKSLKGMPMCCDEATEAWAEQNREYYEEQELQEHQLEINRSLDE